MRLHCNSEGALAHLFLPVGDQRVRDIFQRSAHGLLITYQGLLLACVLHVNIGPDTASIKDGPVYAGTQ